MTEEQRIRAVEHELDGTAGEVEHARALAQRNLKHNFDLYRLDFDKFRLHIFYQIHHPHSSEWVLDEDGIVEILREEYEALYGVKP